jgi:hypothetical protein
MEKQPADSRPAANKAPASDSRTRNTAAYVLLGLFCLFTPFSLLAV